MSIDVTAAVNLHREGSAALPSMISAWRSVEHARAHGINAELLLVLDRSDDSTTRVADRWTSRGARVVHVDVGDLGAARNRAVATCGDSEWIAFLDADDLWGEYWLTAAYTAVLESGGESQHDVWHPAVNIIFGDHHSLLHHVDSSDASFSWARFRLHNQWTALSFVRRSTIEDIPYPRNDLASGFGFEDWSWNEEVLRRGGRHRVVADTCHFIHRSSNPSLLSQSQHALRTPYTSDNTTEFRRPTPAARTEVPERPKRTESPRSNWGKPSEPRFGWAPRSSRGFCRPCDPTLTTRHFPRTFKCTSRRRISPWRNSMASPRIRHPP